MHTVCRFLIYGKYIDNLPGAHFRSLCARMTHAINFNLEKCSNALFPSGFPDFSLSLCKTKFDGNLVPYHLSPVQSMPALVLTLKAFKKLLFPPLYRLSHLSSQPPLKSSALKECFEPDPTTSRT